MDILSSCNHWSEQVRRERYRLTTASREKLGPARVTITGIERVFYHDLGSYSFLVRQGDGTLRVVKPLYPNQDVWIRATPLIIDDVSSGSSMKAEWWGDDERFTWRYEIHVHSINDIEGGAWDHGKFGHGQIQVLR